MEFFFCCLICYRLIMKRLTIQIILIYPIDDGQWICYCIFALKKNAAAIVFYYQIHLTQNMTLVMTSVCCVIITEQNNKTRCCLN